MSFGLSGGALELLVALGIGVVFTGRSLITPLPSRRNGARRSVL